MDYTFSHINMNAIGDSITRGTYTAQGESIPAIAHIVEFNSVG